MEKEKAPTSGANHSIRAANLSDESAISQGRRIVGHLKTHGTLTTLEARQCLGIMNPAQRISELRKRGQPIETARTYQTDESGVVHRVAMYIWRGEPAKQGDLWEGFQS